VNLRVGGRDHAIPIAARKFGRGVTFEAPRGSLVTALRYEIFDDLLIGNFMKTTLHGRWPQSRLYPDFTPYVAKYGDNGRARTGGRAARVLCRVPAAQRRIRVPAPPLRGESSRLVRSSLRVDFGRLSPRPAHVLEAARSQA
jgi:hypothetical protein